MILSSLFLLGAIAQDSISLASAIRTGLEEHPVIASAEADYRRSRSAALEARSARLPEVLLEGTAVRFQQPMIVAPLHAFDLTSPPTFNRTLLQSRLVANYLVFDGGRRSGAIAQSQAAELANDVSLSGARMNVIVRVANAYLGLLTSQALSAAADRQLAALTADRQRVFQLFEAGRAARVDLLRIDAALAQATATSSDAAGQAASDRRRLEGDLGLALGTLDSVTLQGAPELTPPSRTIDESIDFAMASNPELQSARAALQAAEAARTVAASLKFPSLRLSGGYQTFGSRGGNFTAEWQAGLSVSYPIFRPAGSHQIDRAAALASKAIETLRLAELDVRQTVDAAARAIQTAGERVGALGRAIEHLAEVTRIEQLALSAGAGVQAEYLRAEADLFNTSSQLARARNGLVLAHLTLARALGELTPEWVDRFLENSP